MEITLPKPENSLPKREEQTQKLNDFGLRIVLIPLFAFAVPNLTGLIDYHYPFTTILIHYAYFFLISFSIYFGNRFLLFELSDKFNWFFSPFRKVLTLISGVMLFTIPITIFFISMYYLCIVNTEINWQVMRNVTLMNVICVIFVAHIYETVFLIKQTESEMLKAEKLERSKAEAELEALKNQIDPHFIFNSLNTLSHLIEKNPAKAKQFNDTLADVYRYILQNKGRNL
ncbi:MAG: histidine kinase, partial [Fimbriimonadaceae bacterium]|nr:histidine kinase [Chitinophagales bacterium]